MALAAAGAVKGAIPKSGTVGAVVLLGGVLLVYWALYRSRDGRGLFGLGERATRSVGLLDVASRYTTGEPFPKDWTPDNGGSGLPGRPVTPTSPEIV